MYSSAMYSPFEHQMPIPNAEGFENPSRRSNLQPLQDCIHIKNNLWPKMSVPKKNFFRGHKWCPTLSIIKICSLLFLHIPCLVLLEQSCREYVPCSLWVEHTLISHIREHPIPMVYSSLIRSPERREGVLSNLLLQTGGKKKKKKHQTN